MVCGQETHERDDAFMLALLSSKSVRLSEPLATFLVVFFNETSVLMTLSIFYFTKFRSMSRQIIRHIKTEQREIQNKRTRISIQETSNNNSVVYGRQHITLPEAFLRKSQSSS